MFALKPKQKPETPAPSFVEDWKDKGNWAMQKLFGVSKDWYKERDIAKNNYLLGVMHFRMGSPFDAVLRFKFVTWLNPKHADAWYGLGRAYLMDGKRAAAEKALKKAVELNPSHADAKTLIVVIPKVYDAAKPAIAVTEVGKDSCAALARLHHDAFLKDWNEKAFADLLAIAGTQSWITGVPQLPMGMIVGRALGEQYEILTLAVSPDWRGRGLAKQLMEALTARAKETGAKTIFLEVQDDNKVARAFYDHAGFAIIDTRKNYYKQPDGTYRDAVVMSKVLDS
jgi:ribosomal-protein-alanine N-acetyltransferase